MINTDYIANLIIHQMEFSKQKDAASIYYDEIVEGVKKYANDCEIVSHTPTGAKVYRTQNFQFFTNGKDVRIANKFF